jgi:Zn-dependent peptidase ImmA (M78 family)
VTEHHLTEQSLIDCLEDNIKFYDLLRSYNITVATASLKTIYGFVYADPSGAYLIIINDNINHETQIKTLLHEIKHIIYDMPQGSYFITPGLDIRHESSEQEADKFADYYLNIQLKYTKEEFN